MSRDQDTSTLAVECVIHKTDKAALCELFPGGEEIWLPLSVCDILEELDVGDGGPVEVPNWLLIEKELEDYIEE